MDGWAAWTAATTTAGPEHAPMVPVRDWWCRYGIPGLRRVPDDHHRATGVIDAVLADRAEQLPDEIPKTVTTDDEQLGVLGFAHEHRTGPSCDYPTCHAGALIGTECLLDSGLKLTAGIGLVVP